MPGPAKPPFNPLEGLRKASSIGRNPEFADAQGDPYEMKMGIMPMPPLGGAINGLKGLLGFGQKALPAAEEALGAALKAKMTPTPQEVRELFPRAQGVLGEPLEQAKQRMFEQRWQMRPRVPSSAVQTPAARVEAEFLGHGPDGPLYNIKGGAASRSTVSPEALKAQGIGVPETPAPGPRLNGDQIRAALLKARALKASP